MNSVFFGTTAANSISAAECCKFREVEDTGYDDSPGTGLNITNQFVVD